MGTKVFFLCDFGDGFTVTEDTIADFFTFLRNTSKGATVTLQIRGGNMCLYEYSFPKHQLCKIYKSYKSVHVEHRNNGGSWSPWARTGGLIHEPHLAQSVLQPCAFFLICSQISTQGKTFLVETLGNRQQEWEGRLKE